MFTQRAIAVATGRSPCHKAFELRQNQIQYLKGFDFQRALLKKEAQRISGFVTRHLQYAFIHREHHDARWLAGGVFEFDRIAGLHQVWRLDCRLEFAAIQIHRERLHAICQRAGIDFVRTGIAYKRYRYISVAFEILGQGDFLRGRRGLAGKPRMRVHTLTLDGNQARADIRRLYRQFNFIACAEIFFAEFHLQLGVFLERTRQIRSTCHFVRHPCQILALRITHDVGVAARCIGSQCHFCTPSSNGEWFLIQLNTLFTRFIFVSVVRLLGQHRHEFSLKVDQLQILGICLGRLGIDGDQLHAALAGT